MITNNPAALGWKYNHEPGITCRQNSRGSFDIIEWPRTLPQLTQQIVDQAEAEYSKHLSDKDYRNKRAADYIRELSAEGTFEHTVGDLLDGLISAHLGDPDKLNSMIPKILAIKDRHPKP